MAVFVCRAPLLHLDMSVVPNAVLFVLFPARCFTMVDEEQGHASIWELLTSEMYIFLNSYQQTNHQLQL
ncbi:hypothetical protein Hanom_Chr09g00848221 [Helianthus anomalus]